ncbi:MAG: hypothetical protein ACI9MB_001027, partial [Verrucomicrobiales bacterium]
DVLHNGSRNGAYHSGHWGDDITGGSNDPGNWHHVTWTNTDQTQEIFVDGVSISSGGSASAGSFNNNLSQTLLIGTSRNGGSFRGSLDDVGVFSTTLSNPQIAAIYNLGIHPDYGYDVGEINDLIVAYQGGAGSSVTIGDTTWEHAGLDPVDGRYFIQLDPDASGMLGSTGPPVRGFVADHVFIPTGMPITLSWDVGTDATTLSIDQGIGDVLPLTNDGTGQFSINPGPLANTTYTLTVSNAVGTNTAEVTVSVTAQPIIGFFTASQIVVAPDTPVQLDWSVLNVDSLDLNGSDVGGTSGLTVMPTETTTWTLSATNAQGTSSEQITITVVIPGEPVISEISADNHSIFNDQDGDSSDWIEISNPSATTAILHGYYLSDDSDDLRKWRLPDMTLEAGGHLVIFASGKDRAVAGSELHTNFGLRAGGEYLALSKLVGAQTTILSEFDPYPKQFEDITWGYFSDGITQGYFTTPTPGAANGNGILDFVRDTNFLPKRGFYDSPIGVVISSATPDVQIRYTTDGSAPSTNSGTIYTAPITISTTTTLRAIASKAGHLPTNVDTQTYIFLDDVLQQPANPPGFPSSWRSTGADYEMDPTVVTNPLYSATIKDDLKSIPSVSIVMRTEDMFGSSGIYANPNGQGSGFERAGSVELMSADGSRDMQVNCAVRIQGGVGRNAGFLKHSFRLLFKRGFGPTKLDYPLFQDATEDADGATEQFDTVILRSGFNNSWHRDSTGEEQRAQYIRDQWVHDAQLAMGDASSHGTFVHVYLNGLYWGLYNLVERPNAPFASAYYGGGKNEWDALNSYPRNVVDGTDTAWLAAHALADAGVPDQAGYDAISEYVDIPNLINYMMLNFYGGNNDWDDHNWYSGRRRLPGEGYKFFCWDAERTLESVSGSNRTGVNQAQRPSRLYAALKENPEFRLQFADHAQRHLFNDGALSPGQCAARYQKLASFIDRAIVGESARWGDSQREPAYTRNATWVTERDRLLNSYFPQRTDVLLGHLRGADLYPDTDAPIFSQHGGHVSSTTELAMSNNGGIIYYTTDGSDPRLQGGAINPAAQTYDGSTLTTTIIAAGSDWKYLDDGSDQGSAWRALGFNDAAWAAGPAELGYGDGAEATEVGYGPNGGSKYITTYFRKTFTGTGVADFTSLSLELVRDDGAIVYLNGDELVRSNMPGGTVGHQTTAAGTVGGGDESSFFSFAIPTTSLIEGQNTIAVEIHQTSGGSSDISFDLRLRGARSNSADPLLLTETAPLRARALDGGEWSALNEATFIVDAEVASSDNIVISEIHYRPLPPTPAEEEAGYNERSNFEFVEVINIGSADVDMTNVRFTSGITFDFDDSAIGFLLSPGQRVVVVNNLEAFQMRNPSVSVADIAGEFSGNFNNDGEQITLLASDDSIIRDFAYNDQSPWPESADGDGFSLVLIHPASNPDHADPFSWRPSISLHGNPVASDARAFTGNPADDNDEDKVPAMIEYLLGTSDAIASAETLPTVLVQNLTVDAVPDDYLTIAFNLDLSADDVAYLVQLSNDLSAWISGPSMIEFVSRTNHGDGTATMVYRSANPISVGTRTFVRLQATLR